MRSDHTRFNSKVYIYNIYLDAQPVLHLINDATRFCAAKFLPIISTIAILVCILNFWDTVYTGLPYEFVVDQDSQFQKAFAELSELQDVKAVQTGIQSHR